MSSLRKVFSEGVLSNIVDEINTKEPEKATITSGTRGEMEPDQVEYLTKETTELNEMKPSRESVLMKADNFPRYVLLRATSRDPNVMVRRFARASSSDSEVVTGLDIWRQMAVTYARSAQTQVGTRLKQIMPPTEWNPGRSPSVLQMHHHWLELISKCESLSSEKIASSIKIT